jgi:hypothetical protein
MACSCQSTVQVIKMNHLSDCLDFPSFYKSLPVFPSFDEILECNNLMNEALSDGL